MVTLLIFSCLLLTGPSLAQSTDDLLRLEIEEAATDSRLLAEELANMLARLEADESRQEAVEAVVTGEDDAKVENALQDMLSKLESLEQVASEESKTEELKGSLDDKIKKEAELRETLETLETVAKEIKEASSTKEVETVEEVTQLLNSINSEIESKSGSSVNKFEEFQSALHLNGIDEMIRSLEKVTGELQDMQDNINDYFNDDSDTDSDSDIGESTPAPGLEEEEINNSTSKTLSEILTNRTSSAFPEDIETDGETEQRSRNPKQLEDDAEYYDEFSDAEVEEAVDNKSYSGSNEDQKEAEAGEDCSEVEAKNRVSLCLPKFRSVDQEVKLYSSKLEEVRHCYDV